MTGNHWTVFNGAGAVVCDNMPQDVAEAYLTPERAERGWHAVYCLIVRDPADFPRGVTGIERAEAARRLLNAGAITEDELTAEINNARAAEGLPPLAASGVQASCEWREEDPDTMPGTYATACGELWAFTEGGTKENGMKFCHNCGKPVSVVERPAEPTDDDGVPATPKPYAYEFGRSNGDGTYSVVIERGSMVNVGLRRYEYGPPRDPHPDHPVKPLYELPPTCGVAGNGHHTNCHEPLMKDDPT